MTPNVKLKEITSRAIVFLNNEIQNIKTINSEVKYNKFIRKKASANGPSFLNQKTVLLLWY
jgi:hypothetical protein